MRIGVVKHDVHGDDDRPGSDTDLITRAGASCTVLITPRDRVTRTATQPSALSSTVLQLLATNDVVLLEGFKREPVAKVWLEHPSQQKPPPDLSHVIATLPWTSNRSDHLIPIVRRWFDTTWHRRSVFGGVLIGGRSPSNGASQSSSWSMAVNHSSNVSTESWRPSPIGSSRSAMVHYRLLSTSQGYQMLWTRTAPWPGSWRLYALGTSRGLADRRV